MLYHQMSSWRTLRRPRYSVYLLYCYKSTNTDTLRAQTPIINPDVSEYHAALEKKAERVRALLGDHLKVPLHVEPSSPLHYRMRAEFRIWHVGEECHFTHFDPQTKKPIFVEQYPLACARINEIMIGLQGAFKDLRDIRHKLFQV